MKESAEKLVQITSKYLPDIIAFVGKDNKRLDKLSDYKERYFNLARKYNTYEIIPQHCLLESILFAENGCEISKTFLNYLNNLFIQISTKVNKKCHPELKKTFLKILTSFDTNTELKNNPSYLNYFGEILCLNKLLSISEYDFELKKIAFKITNKKDSKDFDFHFFSKSINENFLIEVQNIHYLKTEITDIDFENNLIETINNKIISKTENPIIIEYSNNKLKIDNIKYTVLLQPVLWDESDQLIQFQEVFSKFNTKFENVLPIMHFTRSINSDGLSEYFFIKYSEYLNSN